MQYMCLIVIFSKASFGCTGKKMERGKAQHYTSDPQPPVGKIIQARYACITTDKILSEHSSYFVTYKEATFCKIGLEITWGYKTDLRFTATAILALHPASEYFLVEVMEKTHLAALHRKRIMIAPKDMHLIKAIAHMW